MKSLIKKLSCFSLIFAGSCFFVPDTFARNSMEQTLTILNGKVEERKQKMVQEIEKHVSGYLVKHINYPAKAKEKAVQGRVICSFYINKNGEISEPAILRGLGEDIDKEVLRVFDVIPPQTESLSADLFTEDSLLIVVPIHFNLMKPVSKK